MIAKVRINEHNAKKNFFFFALSSESTFNEVKGTDKRAQCKEKLLFFALPSESTFNEVKGGIAPYSNKREAPAVTNHVQGLMKGGVVPPGIEPGTHGFSVRCSTN